MYDNSAPFHLMNVALESYKLLCAMQTRAIGPWWVNVFEFLWLKGAPVHQQSAQFLVTFLDLFAFSQGQKVKRSQSFDLFPKSLLQLIDKIILFKIKNLNFYYFYYFSLIPTF